GEVSGRAGVRLDVGVLDAEDGLGALDGQRLDEVDVLLAFVVATARVPLAVLVLKDGSGGFQNGGGDVVLAGNQPQRIGLEPLLGADERGEFGVGGGQRGMRKGLCHGVLRGGRSVVRSWSRGAQAGGTSKVGLRTASPGSFPRAPVAVPGGQPSPRVRRRTPGRRNTARPEQQ